MTAPRDSIVFNSSTGSDTAASGLGPSAAITGTAAAHTSGSASTTITLTNTPDLSGVQAGDLLWLNTASGRQFSVIASVNDGADTVTVDDSFNIASGSPVDYAIGGKRATWDNADSRTIFVDAKGGWIIGTETNQTLTSVLGISGVASASAGHVKVRGLTGTPIINQTANAACIVTYTNYITIEDLQFTNSNGTKTSAYGIDVGGVLRVVRCILGDQTNTLHKGFARTGGTPFLMVVESEIKYCTGAGIDDAFIFNQGLNCGLINCRVHHNGSHGVYVNVVSGSAMPVFIGNIFHHNSGTGLYIADGSATPVIVGNVFAHNTSHGLAFAATGDLTSAIIQQNIFGANGAYNVSIPADSEYQIWSADWNGFFTSTSGHRSNLTAGDNDVEMTADPFVDAANSNFNLNNEVGGGKLLRQVAIEMP